MNKWALIKLQLVNIYGLNEYRHIKDRKEKGKKTGLLIAYILVALMMMGYVAALSFGYILMGLGDILPAYLIMLASVVVIMFALFKAGGVIFQRNAFDIIFSLPVKSSDIVISRFVRLYVENVLLAVMVMIPAISVYGLLLKPSWTFYIIGLIVAVFIPFIPIIFAVVFGSFILAVSSRAKHKNLVSIVLSILVVVVIMSGSISMSSMESSMSIEELQDLINLFLGFINKVYPPAVWLGNAMLTGNFLQCIACVCGGFALFAIVIGIISAKFKWICSGLYSTTAKHNYKMENLESSHILVALCKREFKRYFASSVYVTNTIMGPVMAVLFAVAMAVLSPEHIESGFVEIYMQTGVRMQTSNLFPMALAAILSMMPITPVSISMEGKQWWIVKSLPLRTKDVLDAKLVMNIILWMPFYLVSAVVLAIGQKANFMETVWMFVVPFVFMIFSMVFGQTANLKLAVFDWDNEASVVKQSASAFVGGIIPFFVMIPVAMGAMLIPAGLTNLSMFGFSLIFGLLTYLLYRYNCSVNLRNI